MERLLNDKYISEQIALGDVGAYTELYQHYHPLIYRYALGFLKLPELAEDLVHEVFLKIWEKRDQLAIQTSLSAYLYAICRNQAIDMLRRVAADQKLKQAIIHQLEIASNEQLSDAERMERYETALQQSLASMPAQRRRVYELCRQQGMSYDQAAAELGLSRNTIKEHMVKALSYLRKDLLDRGDLVLLSVLIEKLF